MPTTFNFLGPLANPAHVKRQAVGVSDETMATRMLGALRLLGTEQAMVFHGDDGLDELTTSTTSTVHELVDGEVRSFTLDPLDLGIPRASADTLAGGDAPANANAIHAVLARREGIAPRHRGVEHGGRAGRRRARPRSRQRRRSRGRGDRRRPRRAVRSRRSCASATRRPRPSRATADRWRRSCNAPTAARSTR